MEGAALTHHFDHFGHPVLGMTLNCHLTTPVTTKPVQPVNESSP
jgi:hypothetical protein